MFSECTLKIAHCTNRAACRSISRLTSPLYPPPQCDLERSVRPISISLRTGSYRSNREVPIWLPRRSITARAPPEEIVSSKQGGTPPGAFGPWKDAAPRQGRPTRWRTALGSPRPARGVGDQFTHEVRLAVHRQAPSCTIFSSSSGNSLADLQTASQDNCPNPHTMRHGISASSSSS